MIGKESTTVNHILALEIVQTIMRYDQFQLYIVFPLDSGTFTLCL